MAQAGPRHGSTAAPRRVGEVGLILLLVGLAVAAVLLVVWLGAVAAPFPDPGRLPSPRPAGG